MFHYNKLAGCHKKKVKLFFCFFCPWRSNKLCFDLLMSFIPAGCLFLHCFIAKYWTEWNEHGYPWSTFCWLSSAQTNLSFYGLSFISIWLTDISVLSHPVLVEQDCFCQAVSSHSTVLHFLTPHTLSKHSVSSVIQNSSLCVPVEPFSKRPNLFNHSYPLHLADPRVQGCPHRHSKLDYFTMIGQ